MEAEIEGLRRPHPSEVVGLGPFPQPGPFRIVAALGVSTDPELGIDIKMDRQIDQLGQLGAGRVDALHDDQVGGPEDLLGREDEWISSHLELRGERGELLSGYGWIFPLGGGQVNLGVGTLATARRPADVALRPLMTSYAAQRREEWELGDELRMPTSALLPMGGAVSGVAGRNWALIGDAAACVNPLNGEGIDYGLEAGRLLVDLLNEDDLGRAWPALLRSRYGRPFSIARRLAGLITVPGLLGRLGPIGMGSRGLMAVALRVMGNLITDEDHDLVARAWRTAGRLSHAGDSRPPFS